MCSRRCPGVMVASARLLRIGRDAICAFEPTEPGDRHGGHSRIRSRCSQPPARSVPVWPSPPTSPSATASASRTTTPCGPCSAKNMSHGLEFNMNYKWTKSMDINSLGSQGGLNLPGQQQSQRQLWAVGLRYAQSLRRNRDLRSALQGQPLGLGLSAFDDHPVPDRQSRQHHSRRARATTA